VWRGDWKCGSGKCDTSKIFHSIFHSCIFHSRIFSAPSVTSVDNLMLLDNYAQCVLVSWPPGWVQTAKYCKLNYYVCLSVCLLAYLENHTAELHQIFVHVDCGRGSVLLWWLGDTLYTSGFVDDATILLRGPYAVSFVCIPKQRESITALTSALVRNKLSPSIMIGECTSGAKFAIYDRLAV